MALLGKYSGNILFIPNLALLEFSPTYNYNPPAIPDFHAHFAAFGLTPAKMGSVTFQSSLDYRFLSKSILDGIHDLHKGSSAASGYTAVLGTYYGYDDNS